MREEGGCSGSYYLEFVWKQDWWSRSYGVRCSISYIERVFSWLAGLLINILPPCLTFGKSSSGHWGASAREIQPEFLNRQISNILVIICLGLCTDGKRERVDQCSILWKRILFWTSHNTYSIHPGVLRASHIRQSWPTWYDGRD